MLLAPAAARRGRPRPMHRNEAHAESPNVRGKILRPFFRRGVILGDENKPTCSAVDAPERGRVDRQRGPVAALAKLVGAIRPGLAVVPDALETRLGCYRRHSHGERRPVADPTQPATLQRLPIGHLTDPDKPGCFTP